MSDYFIYLTENEVGVFNLYNFQCMPVLFKLPDIVKKDKKHPLDICNNEESAKERLMQLIGKNEYYYLGYADDFKTNTNNIIPRANW